MSGQSEGECTLRGQEKGIFEFGGYKASPVKDTSYKGLWKISFMLKELQKSE